ncbi:NAD(+)--rifampin ADP-ribosyltransferase [Streptomyces albidoflavus]|uniref:NAD(+)--rifampin ADP-ribosyltransferase n=1 Tax=Streptomyces albidoflavus TaxID=1886 RepID=UPI0033E27D5A
MSLSWSQINKLGQWEPLNSVEHIHPGELEGQRSHYDLDRGHVERLSSSIRHHGYSPERHGHLGLNITDHGENLYHHASGTETHPEDHQHHEHLLQALKDTGHGEVPVHIHDQTSDPGGHPAPRYYHGTTAEDLEHVHPNHSTSGNFGAATHEPGHAYATGLESAWHYAERAADHHGGKPHVYEVHPNGPVEKDPSHDASGRLRGNNHDDVRSRHGFTVVGEEEMPDHLRDHYGEDEDEDGWH